MKKLHACGMLHLIVALALAGAGWFSTALAQAMAPAEVMAKLAAAGGPEKHPEANTILVDMRTEYVYQLDGTYVATLYGLRKILTAEGKKQHGQERVQYYRKYDHVHVTLARVIKPDGLVIDVAPENIKDQTIPEVAAMNIYEPDMRQLVITFPNLEVGDATEYTVIDTCHRAVIQGEFDVTYLFQEIDPVVRDELVVRGPAARPLRYQVQNDPHGSVRFARTEEDGAITYRWWADNQPRIVLEPAMPSLINVSPGVWASTIASWRQISRWGYQLNEQYIDMNEALRAETHRLVRGCATRQDTLLALYHFVAQKVRYMGIGLGKKTGYDPKPATKTYGTKYGVCRDVAVLLTAMLREVGIPAFVVYTSAGYEQYTEIPNLLWSHGIVAVPQEGGYLYIDPTVENGMDLLMSVEAEQVTLVLTAAGDSLARTPYSPAEDNAARFTATTRLHQDGSMTGLLHVEAKGIYDLALRQVVKALPPARLKNVFQELGASAFPGLVVEEVTFGDPEDLYHPLTLDIRLTAQDFALQAGRYLLVKNPLASGDFDILGKQFLRAANLPKRTYPFNLQTTLASLCEETLVIPNKFRVKALPNEVSVERPAVGYSMRFAETRAEEPEHSAAVQFTSKLALKRKIYSPEEYLQLKEVMKTAQRSTRGEIILERVN
ncbi:MAG: DUF3857 domain-containing protein [bacterium]|jgi:transglutaminase-like putative cysteine protease|nr:DUF3857 domain-containing protein [candidate division KSB1 bacterium]MDH7560252.1 DUF3857 domain-containing protein [bacterium]